MDPDAVLFDLDATLCRRRWSPETVLSGAFDEVGVTPYTTASEMNAVVNDVPTAEDDVTFYTNCLEAAAERTNATPERAEAVARSYHRAIDYADVEFVPGAKAALSAVDTPLGLVTNGSEATQRAKLDALGIADRFEVRVFADTGGIKPDPAPFEHALSELDVDPRETVHVGDSLHADVAGANALGIRSVWVSHGADQSVGDIRPDHTIDSPVDPARSPLNGVERGARRFRNEFIESHHTRTMSSLLERLPGHLILFVGIVVAGVASLFVFVSATNLLAWGALTYGVVSVAIGLAIIYR